MAVSTHVNLNIGLIRYHRASTDVIGLLVFFSSPPVDGVLPALIELVVLTSHTVVQYWCLLDGFESLA